MKHKKVLEDLNDLKCKSCLAGNNFELSMNHKKEVKELEKIVNQLDLENIELNQRNVELDIENRDLKQKLTDLEKELRFIKFKHDEE